MKKLIMFVLFGLMVSSLALADEVVVVEDPIVDPIVEVDPIEPEPIVCEEPQVLNEAGDECVDPTPEPVVEKKKRSSGSYLPLVWERMQAEMVAAAQPTVYVWDVVKFGDKGEDVKTLQLYLNNKGAKLVVDGIYGPLTLKAFELLK